MTEKISPADATIQATTVGDTSDLERPSLPEIETPDPLSSGEAAAVIPRPTRVTYHYDPRHAEYIRRQRAAGIRF